MSFRATAPRFFREPFGLPPSFTFSRCPWPTIEWLVPGKVCGHAWFTGGHRLMMARLSGLLMLLKAVPRRTREAVSARTFREFLRLSRSGQ